MASFSPPAMASSDPRGGTFSATLVQDYTSSPAKGRSSLSCCGSTLPGCVLFYHIMWALINLTLFITAVVFFSFLAHDDRTAMVNAYNAYVQYWISMGAEQFSVPPYTFVTNTVGMSSSMVNVNQYNTLSTMSTADPPYPMSGSERDVADYTIFRSYLLSISTASYTLPSDFSTTVQINVTSPNTTDTVRTELPAWFTVTYSQSCSSGYKGSQNCGCSYNGKNIGSNQCQLWFRLVYLCYVYNPSTQSFDPDGCAPSTVPGLTNAEPYLGCVDHKNYGRAYYETSDESPSIGTVYSFDPTIRIRSSDDPYVALIRITNGSLAFPLSQEVKTIVGSVCIVIFILSFMRQYLLLKKQYKDFRKVYCNGRDKTTDSEIPVSSSSNEALYRNSRSSVQGSSIPILTVSTNRGIVI